MLMRLKRAGVRRYTGVREIEAIGKKQVEAVSFLYRGQKKLISCGQILSHQGVVPNVQFSRALDLQHRYCGLGVSELFAATTGRPVAEVGYFRLRSPVKGVTLGELASLAKTTEKI